MSGIAAAAPRTDRSVGLAFAIAAAALLAMAAVRCCSSDVRALAASVQDDSFYYLLTAFRLPRCGFWSFDGEHATYGFQPLYALLLAALGSVCPDRFAMLRAALWLSHLLVVATALVLSRVVRRCAAPCGGERAALLGWLAAALFLFDPPVLLAYTTLKENALYALLLALSLLSVLNARAAPAPRRLALVGALLGLSLLARIVTSTFAVAAVLVLLCRPWRCRRGMLAVAGGLAAATLPWCVYAAVTFGRVLPTSGVVKTAWLQRAAADGSLSQRLSASLAEVPHYVAEVLRFATGQRADFFVPQWWSFGAGTGGIVAAVLVASLLWALLMLWHSRQLLVRHAPSRIVLAALLAALAGTAANPLLLDAGSDTSLLYYAQWYVAAEPLLLAAVAALAWAFVPVAAAAPRPLPRWLPPLFAVALLAAAMPAIWLLRPLPPFAPRADSMVHQGIAMIDRANRTLPADARLGAFNAGVVGFFAERPLCNLDGLANDDVVAARRRGETMFDYVRRQRLDHLLDMLPVRDGWFGDSVFDRLELQDAVPLTLPGHDGYYLLRVGEERFPDFEPRDGGDSVQVRRWQQPGLVAGAESSWRSFHLAPASRLQFFTAGDFGELRANVVTEPGGELRVVGDGQLLATFAAGTTPVVRVGIGAVQVVDVEVSGASAWLADVGFATSSELPAPRLDAGPYGRGWARSGPVPELTADTNAGAVTFRARGLPAGTEVEVLLSLRGGARRVGDYRVLIALPALAVLPLPIDADGNGTARQPLPPGLAASELFAQLVCRRGAEVVASSRGLRVMLAR